MPEHSVSSSKHTQDVVATSSVWSIHHCHPFLDLQGSLCSVSTMASASYEAMPGWQDCLPIRRPYLLIVSWRTFEGKKMLSLAESSGEVVVEVEAIQ
jgi:hypothetical protein